MSKTTGKYEYEWCTDHYPRMSRWGLVMGGNWSLGTAAGSVWKRPDEAQYHASYGRGDHVAEFATLEEAKAYIEEQHQLNEDAIRSHTHGAGGFSACK